MSFEAKQKFQTLVSGAESILIPLPESRWRELLGSALALASVWTDQGKTVSVIVPKGSTVSHLDFISLDPVTDTIDGIAEAKISIDTTKCPISELKYTNTDQSLDIYLTPELHNLTADMVTITRGKYQYDLVCALEVMNWEDLGEVFTDHPRFFQETPTIALSTSGNPQIGKDQWVDWQYASMTEMVYAYLKDTLSEPLSKDLATKLLLGLIQETDNFQTSATSPQSFLAASELMNYGADQEAIIRVLYKTKPLRILKLLGRFMSHLEFLPIEHAGSTYQIAYSKLYQHDFEKTETTKNDIPTVIRELQDHVPANTIGVHVMIETGTNTKHGIIDLDRNTASLVQDLQAEIIGGRIHYSYPTELDVHQACEEINAKIQERL